MTDNFVCDLYLCCVGKAHDKNLYTKATTLFNDLVQRGINCLSNFNNFKFDDKMVETISKSRLFLLVTDGEILVDSVGAILKTAPVYKVINAFYSRFFKGANFGCAKVLCLNESSILPERLHVMFTGTIHFNNSDSAEDIFNWVNSYLTPNEKENVVNKNSLSSADTSKEKQLQTYKNAENNSPKNTRINKVKIINKVPNNAVNGTFITEKAHNDTFIIDGDKLIKYNGNEKYVTIPNGIKQIGERAFYSNDKIAGVKLSKNVEVIGEYAFSNCKNLTDIYFSSELKRIERGAFSNDESLKMLDFNKKLYHIGENAFWGCNSLFAVLIPLSVKEIGANAFDGIKYFIVRCEHAHKPKGFQDGWEGFGDPYWLGIDNAINSDESTDENSDDDWVKRLLAMPMKPSKSRGKNGMNYFSQDFHVINGELVYVSRDLEVIELPSGTKSIAPDLFSDRVNLKSIILPKTLEKIGRGAFAKTGLENIVIPASVKEIEEYAFYGCKNLKSVKIFKGLKALNYSTFANCENLCEINIPLSVESLSELIFYGCDGLTQIKIPSSVTVAKENAFLGANNCVITIGEGIDKNFEYGWNASCKVVKIKL